MQPFTKHFQVQNNGEFFRLAIFGTVRPRQVLMRIILKSSDLDEDAPRFHALLSYALHRPSHSVMLEKIQPTKSKATQKNLNESTAFK